MRVRGFGDLGGKAPVGRAVTVALAVACGIGAFGAPAAAVERKASTSATLPSSAIIIDRDDRLSRDDYSRTFGLTPAAMASRFGATGMVRCGSAVGTGQLVGANNVLVTASHVLFTPGGEPRGRGANCTFEIVAGGSRQKVSVDVDKVVCGAREPYGQPAVKDWAVVPLAGAVKGVKPYMPGTMQVPGNIVLAAAARSGGQENYSLQNCQARKVTTTASSGVREVAIDCDAEGGVSGAAMLSPDGAFLGLYVGFRSAHPGKIGPFSMSHYNFGLSADGALREAITEVVTRARTLSASR
ncbi:trypsin-like peptidase domain-containing protein [Ancylobacter rudongensis]|uniref:Trypsin-like peptidase domain n=1 Tax=Ancylobacter rudongensis TaxID=177413 RepID=A0A1G4UBM7_9HYPH|nr:trypsin-like peptidase domain-containing protein [Ancylobacter rudongensis]SCW91062.1 Trypsin-like peptidase domain [Ancylobacter rudongensis]